MGQRADGQEVDAAGGVFAGDVQRQPAGGLQLRGRGNLGAALDGDLRLPHLEVVQHDQLGLHLQHLVELREVVDLDFALELRVRAAHALQGGDDAAEKVETFYRVRWNKTTPAERRLLIAIARSGAEEMKRADIARAMGVSTTDLSVARESLLGKGILAVPRHGWLAFNAPGFGAFVQNEIEG